MIDVLTQDLGRTSVPLFTLKLKQKQHDPQQAQKQEAKDITYDIAPRLIALTVTDNRGFEADTLTLTLDDADGKIQMPHRGNEVSVAIGRLCQQAAHARSSRYLSSETKERYHQCQNIHCGCTFVTHESLARYIVRPPALQVSASHAGK